MAESYSMRLRSACKLSCSSSSASESHNPSTPSVYRRHFRSCTLARGSWHLCHYHDNLHQTLPSAEGQHTTMSSDQLSRPSCSRRRSLRVRLTDCMSSTSSSRIHSEDDADNDDENTISYPSSDVCHQTDLQQFSNNSSSNNSFSSTATAQYNGIKGSAMTKSTVKVSSINKQELCKTDYTYAKSFIYVSSVTPSRPCEPPNMSRSNMNQNYPLQRLFAGDDAEVQARASADTSLLSRVFGSVRRSDDEVLVRDRQNGSVSSRQNHFVRYNYGLDSESDEDHHLRSTTVKNATFRTSFVKRLFRFFSSSVEVISTSFLVKLNSLFLSIYKGLSSILLFDVWLLSRLHSCRRPWLLMLLMLLLLSGGLWIASDSFEEGMPEPLLAFDDASEVTVYFNQARNVASSYIAGLWSLRFMDLFVYNLSSLWSSQEEASESRLVHIPARISYEIASIKRCLEAKGKYCDAIFSNLQNKILHLEVKVKRLEENYESQQSCCSNRLIDGALVKHHDSLAFDQALVHDESAKHEDGRSVQERVEILENRIRQISDSVNKEKVTEDVAIIREELKNTLRLEFREELLAAMTLMKNTEKVAHEESGLTNDGVSEQSVKWLIREALRLYNADKTGMADFALESGGASVQSTRCTITYDPNPAEISIFGWSVGYVRRSPRLVIQSGVQPGECWAFKGTIGYLVIKLSGIIKPQAFSLEHIPRSISLTGNIDSAPRAFSVWGLNSEYDPNKVLLGRYTYDQYGDAVQFFVVKDPDVGLFGFVELEIHSNHGHPEYTCLYRFRVHGILHSR